MTKRVLATNNVILARSPISIGTPTIGTFIESKLLNHQNLDSPYIRKSQIVNDENDKLIKMNNHIHNSANNAKTNTNQYDNRYGDGDSLGNQQNNNFFKTNDELLSQQQQQEQLFYQQQNQERQSRQDENQSISNIEVYHDDQSPLRKQKSSKQQKQQQEQIQQQQQQKFQYYANKSQMQDSYREKHQEYYQQTSQTNNTTDSTNRIGYKRYQTIQSGKVVSKKKEEQKKNNNNHNQYSQQQGITRLSIQTSQKLFPKQRKSMESTKSNKDYSAVAHNIVGVTLQSLNSTSQSTAIKQQKQQQEEIKKINDQAQNQSESQTNVITKILQQIEPKRLRQKPINSKLQNGNNNQLQKVVQDVKKINIQKDNNINTLTLQSSKSSFNIKNRSTSALKQQRLLNRHPYQSKQFQINKSQNNSVQSQKPDACLTQRSVYDAQQLNELKEHYSLLQKQQTLFSPQQNNSKKKREISSNKIRINEPFASSLKRNKKEDPIILLPEGIKEIDTSQLRINSSIHTQDYENNLLSPAGDKQQSKDDIPEMSISYKDFSLPHTVIILLLQFNFKDYPKYLRLSPAWHCCVNDALDEYTNKIENQFIKKHIRYLNFSKSLNNATPIEFCGEKGLRLDRIFQCEVADNSKIINQNFKIAYSNEYDKQAEKKGKESTRYFSEFRFDIIKKNQKRITWIYMSDEMPPCSQNEIQVSPGDTIEFAVCLFNMNGIVDLNTFNWEDPQLLPIPDIERDPLAYNRDIKLLQKKNDRKTKVHCNINRICEVEDAVPEWIQLGSERRDQPRRPIEFSQYQPRFKVLNVYFNELDIHFNKIVLQAIQKGVVEDFIFGQQLQIKIKGEDEPIINEIKKRGVIFDRNKDKQKIEARVGDIIVIYNSVRNQDPLFTDSTFSLQQQQTSNSLNQSSQDKTKFNSNNNIKNPNQNKQLLTKIN